MLLYSCIVYIQLDKDHVLSFIASSRTKLAWGSVWSFKEWLVYNILWKSPKTWTIIKTTWFKNALNKTIKSENFHWISWKWKLLITSYFRRDLHIMYSKRSWLFGSILMPLSFSCKSILVIILLNFEKWMNPIPQTFPLYFRFEITIWSEVEDKNTRNLSKRRVWKGSCSGK